MKQIFTIALCFLTVSMMAQAINSDEVNYIISIQNSAGEPLQNQEVTAMNTKKTDEVHTKFTTTQGKVKFILKRGETYNIAYLNQQFTASIPLKGMSFMTKKIIYDGQLSLAKPAAFDTIILQKVPKTPTETEALFQLILKDKEGKFYKYLDVWLVQPTINKVYYAQTNGQGYATFRLPIGYDYQVNFKRDENYHLITVPKQPNLRFRTGFTYTSNFMDIKEVVSNDTIFQIVSPTQKATLKRALIKVMVWDLDGNPLPEEKVYLQGKDKVYTAETDADGQAALLLPKGNHYAVNFEYRDSLEVLHIEPGNYTRTDYIRYKYLGTKAIARRILEREWYAARWDSLARVRDFRDSLAASRSDFSGFSWKLNEANIADLIRQRAAEDKKNLADNPKFFEQVGDEVAAALYRNRGRWKNKIIVTDLTGSMYPYLDQILSWHILDQNNSINNQYVFFNDGDQTPDSKKIIGQIGGLYYTDADNLESLTGKMMETMQGGGGADSPENDIEALLHAIDKRKTNRTEIILIADNNSDIKDFKLLHRLNVPVRVILAGTEWIGANEQYLELAYQTKGSVHTIETDIENLFELNDGENINIGNNSYRISGGKFLRIDRL